MRVCIIGGGIIGLSIAFELALQKIETIIIDTGFKPGAASPVAGGMLEPLAFGHDMLETGLQSWALYPDFLKKLKTVSPLETGYHQSGILYLNRTLSDYPGHLKSLQAYNFHVEELNADAIKSHEPLLDNTNSALYSSGTAQLEPKKLFYALYDACAKLGVQFITEHASGFFKSDQAIKAVQTNQQSIPADCFVITAGAWSNKLLQELNTPATAIKPVKGQIANLKSTATINHIIHDTKSFYLIPRHDGRITIGATVEFDAGFDNAIDPVAIDYLKQQAVQLFPALQDAKILNAASGFRPYNGTDKPYVGMAPGLDNLYFATGHYRNGILLAPWTAQKIVTEIIS